MDALRQYLAGSTGAVLARFPRRSSFPDLEGRPSVLDLTHFRRAIAGAEPLLELEERAATRTALDRRQRRRRCDRLLAAAIRAAAAELEDLPRLAVALQSEHETREREAGDPRDVRRDEHHQAPGAGTKPPYAIEERR